ncbi:MAG: CO dehydrogenase/CO-methylating acetyl-CoA synthase complex subunit beta [Candidatus Hydrothermarchaeales archaeon]
MIKDFPTDIGLIYEGERIRKQNMFVELGGPKTTGVELLEVAPVKKVKDEAVKVIGHDISEMKEGIISPFGIYVQVAGTKLEEDLEGVFERRIHDFCNYVQGFMHLNSRDIIWCRINKDAKKAGLTLKHVGQALALLFKNEFDVIKKIQITFYTDEKEAEKFHEKAKKVYEKRDARIRGLSEEDVDVFYGCVLCQSFAPEHVCTITPDRTSSCGSISWFEGRAAVKVDPKGPLVEVPKGELLDPEKFEYLGVNEMSNVRSQGAVDQVYLHSIFDHPHTSCGCFEAIAFYIPEVDGIGVVHRDFKGVTPFGIPFSTMAGQTGGGQQLSGFSGVAKEYLRSPKFFIGDGGWNRMVWLPKELYDEYYDDIPEDVRDKIATEENATDLEGLKNYLKEKDHPVVKNWKEEVVEEEMPAMEVAEIQMSSSGVPMSVGGGITIIFKNAKIYAEKVIIKKEK